MSLPNEVRVALTQATWSLKEGAFYSQGRAVEDRQMNPLSHIKVDAVYFWLVKEDEKGNFKVLATVDGEKRYSPGTLLRALSEREDKPLNTKVFEAYKKIGGYETSAGHSAFAWDFYRSFAEKIWAQYPNATISAVAIALEDLPLYWQQDCLPSFSANTIRKKINQLHAGKVGAPKKETVAVIDLEAIVKKIDL